MARPVKFWIAIEPKYECQECGAKVSEVASWESELAQVGYCRQCIGSVLALNNEAKRVAQQMMRYFQERDNDDLS